MPKILLKFNLHPNEKHLAYIEKWLIEEWSETKQGFYSNWNMISNAYTEKRLSIITENDNAIGFMVYRIYDLTSVIDIAEIKPSERKKGFAKKMIDGTFEFFKSKGILVIQLFCSPENSEPFWKKVGFLNFPEFPHNSQIKMYKPLIQTLKLINLSEFENDDWLMLVNHTVWPEGDSVAALYEYSQKYEAKPNKWWFLTGDKEQLYTMARKSYLAVPDKADPNFEHGSESDFIHTENFILVDPDKRIRGMYDGTNSDEVSELIKDIYDLKREYGF